MKIKVQYKEVLIEIDEFHNSKKNESIYTGNYTFYADNVRDEIKKLLDIAKRVQEKGETIQGDNYTIKIIPPEK
jgi:hypothetical protein